MQLLDRALTINPTDLESLAGKAETSPRRSTTSRCRFATYGLILAQMKDDPTKGPTSPIKCG